MIHYAWTFLHKPYKWGGSNPLQGLDCSGLVQQILKSVGLAPKVRYNSKQLYEFYLKDGTVGKLGPGALCFYGKDAETISHVSFMIDEYRVIEAGSGDQTTINFDEAAKRGACVRMRPYNARPDFLCSIMPNYPDWVKGSNQ